MNETKVELWLWVRRGLPFVLKEGRVVVAYVKAPAKGVQGGVCRQEFRCKESAKDGGKK